MSKKLQPVGSRSPVSIRELILVVALVIAGACWYKEFERSRDLSQEMESVKYKLGGILDAENTLRSDPERKPVQLIMTEMADPNLRLRWTMELKALDDKHERPHPPSDIPSPESKPPVSKAPESKPPLSTPPVSTPPESTAPESKAPESTPPESTK